MYAVSCAAVVVVLNAGMVTAVGGRVPTAANTDETGAGVHGEPADVFVAVAVLDTSEYPNHVVSGPCDATFLASPKGLKWVLASAAA